MYPASFEYHRVASVEEAVGLLTRYRDDAKLLAGGHSLVPMMKLRLAQPKHVIDIGRVPGLAGIREEGGQLVIGALTTHYAIESSALVRQRCPVLAEAAAMIGDPQVRNYGTMGGSLAHADPAADWPAVVLALGAELRATGPKGARTLKAKGFFRDLFTTALGPDEVLTEIRIPVPPARSGAAYVKHPHPASRFAVVGVAAAVTLDGAGNCREAHVGVTGVGSNAVRAKGVEAALAGKAADAAAIAAASQKAADGIAINADLQGSEEYKAHLTRVYTRRALERAVERAKGAR
ncbi:MAG TPA: xanthine dehydrogenase family protein subunit M [Methylomirabilota bacterium]|jgi:carbon-monoxide dehydrogenase medium subunit|nr:xanthine dehydrogenase family protein subunit M [Methylomirabilota bacterium]